MLLKRVEDAATKGEDGCPLIMIATHLPILIHR